MQEIKLSLDDYEFETVRDMKTADAAVEICKIYFRRQDPAAPFPPSRSGADLFVRFSDDTGLDIEVKGTKESDIAWQQLKVSGKPSHEMLKNGMPVYRVTNIGSQNVTILVLRYGEDFEMTPEPRWRVHPPRSRA